MMIEGATSKPFRTHDAQRLWFQIANVAPFLYAIGFRYSKSVASGETYSRAISR